MGNIFGFTDDEPNVLIGEKLEDQNLPLYPQINIYLTDNTLELGTRIRKRLPKQYITNQATHYTTVCNKLYPITKENNPYKTLEKAINQFNIEIYANLHLALYDPSAVDINGKTIYSLDNNINEKERIIKDLL